MEQRFNYRGKLIALVLLIYYDSLSLSLSPSLPMMVVAAVVCHNVVSTERSEKLALHVVS